MSIGQSKSFLTLKDYSKEEILSLIDSAIELKKEKKNGIYKKRLENKSIAMIFEKTSTRTRCATSIACFDEGAHAEFLNKNDIQMGKKESIKDTARVLGRMFDAILFRGFKQEIVERLSEFSGIPVVNGLTDEYHPTQILADFMTIKEKFNKLEDLKIVFLGDAKNNVSNSLLIGAAKLGIKISIAAPKKFWPEKNLVDYLSKINNNSSNIIISEDPFEVLESADVVYTDVWVSMGEEKSPKINDKIDLMKPYKVDKKIMSATKKESSIFMHCLPATHDGEMHNMEVTEEVFESKQSCVFEQAENRLHTIKAILIALLEEEN